MYQEIRSLGRQEAKVVLRMVEEKRTVVTTEGVREFVDSSVIGARRTIRRLIDKGWLQPVGGGRYVLIPPEYGSENIGEYNILALASAAVQPSYVGWWSAAAYHGFTTQKPMLVDVATTRSVNKRLIHDTEVVFVKLLERKFFGFEPYQVYGRETVISNPEKTLIDCIDRLDLCGGVSEAARIAFGAARHVDHDRLVDDVLRMGSVSAGQRLGYLMDVVGASLEGRARKRLLDAIPRSARSVLGRPDPGPNDVGYVSDWGLLVNFPEDRLLGDVPRLQVPTGPGKK